MKPALGPTGNVSPPANLPIDLLRVPLSISLMFTSPIRTNLLLSPVGTFIVPLVESNVLFGSLIISFLNLFINFLFKLQIVRPPGIPCAPNGLANITLTMPQLTQLMTAYISGKPIDQFLKHPGNTFGPFGGDEPLFPDNLSVILVLAAPFADFDGSPDTNFNVPLFEVPGSPGSLVIALLILIARFVVEQGGLALNNNPGNPNPAPVDSQTLIRYLMNLKGSGR